MRRTFLRIETSIAGCPFKFEFWPKKLGSVPNHIVAFKLSRSSKFNIKYLSYLYYVIIIKFIVLIRSFCAKEPFYEPIKESKSTLLNTSSLKHYESNLFFF